MSHPLKPDNKVDTFFNLKNTRRLRIAESASESSDDEPASYVPTAIAFILSDDTRLVASTAREIILGRHSRPEDPPVTIDLHPHQGHEHGVSRFHAMIVASNGGMVIRDLGSVNGTILNGALLQPAKSYTLRPGDVLALGHMVLKVAFVD
ncbi:MAG: FHA domain-containing protein [Anaerolineae bacterium]|nr:FHA domain-containing protein [Anaerolineae bacterium]MDW8172658.1 FHA domain-containing protein [Anaerolineae bacterium]